VEVAPGIAHAAFEARPPEASPFGGHAFRVDLERAELHLVPAGGETTRRSVAEIAAGRPQAVAVNASFFDEDGRAMGLGVDEGRLLAARLQRAWGALLVDDAGGRRTGRVVRGAELGEARRYRLVVQGIPRLVVDGRVPRLKPQVAERTAACAAGREVLLVVASEAESNAFARFLAAPRAAGGLGCRDALNLDGGSSTQLFARFPDLELSLRGAWGVPNALVATPRAPEGGPSAGP
jgi:uncharacterized protein YigE (DUF2233 family)